MCALPERVRAGEEPLDRQAWRARAEALAAQGQRVLAVADQAVPDRKSRARL